MQSKPWEAQGTAGGEDAEGEGGRASSNRQSKVVADRPWAMPPKPEAMPKTRPVFTGPLARLETAAKARPWSRKRTSKADEPFGGKAKLVARLVPWVRRVPKPITAYAE